MLLSAMAFTQLFRLQYDYTMKTANDASIQLILHDIRSAHNVGSLLRSADGLGISRVHLTGYTPYPEKNSDERLPHIAKKVAAAIQKTALGAELNVDWKQSTAVTETITRLKETGFKIVALEQSPDATCLHDFRASEKIALLVGNEVTGVPTSLLELCDETVVIPMLGKKESFNVSAAGAMALHWLRYNA